MDTVGVEIVFRGHSIRTSIPLSEIGNPDPDQLEEVVTAHILETISIWVEADPDLNVTYLLLDSGESMNLSGEEINLLLTEKLIYACYDHAETDTPEPPIYHLVSGVSWEDISNTIGR